MPNVVFVAPFFLETTLRFVDAVASLPGVRTGVISQDPADKLPRQLLHLAHHRRLVPQRAHLQVVGDVLARHRRQRLARLVADADDARADARQPAREIGHLGRIAGRDHQDVQAHPSSTRTFEIRCFSPSCTTRVSGWRRMT